jgi:hypothetical protein
MANSAISILSEISLCLNSSFSLAKVSSCLALSKDPFLETLDSVVCRFISSFMSSTLLLLVTNSLALSISIISSTFFLASSALFLSNNSKSEKYLACI